LSNGIAELTTLDNAAIHTRLLVQTKVALVHIARQTKHKHRGARKKRRWRLLRLLVLLLFLCLFLLLCPRCCFLCFLRFCFDASDLLCRRNAVNAR
jgi:hypothetical protein